MFHTFSFLNIKYDLPIEQFVLWIGKGKCKIPDSITISSGSTQNTHKYKVIDIRDIAPEIFLESDKPELVVLSVLAKAENKNALAERIIKRFFEMKISEKDLLNYLLNLEILAELRDIKIDFKEVRAKMPIDLKVDVRKLWSYQESKTKTS